ncbi:hypothetical protein WN944_016598 [Citrus x changshan-huyou]|uniref:Uncharacterized protein n=1 Tax=Citrus x changshan-huyou TaxID=2935761 RepID=A0AAP0QMY6_9ROSI
MNVVTNDVVTKLNPQNECDLYPFPSRVSWKVERGNTSGRALLVSLSVLFQLKNLFYFSIKVSSITCFDHQTSVILNDNNDNKKPQFIFFSPLN